MPTYRHGKSARVLLDGAPLYDILNTANIDLDADTAETSHFGDDDRTYVAGQRSGTFSASGMMDGSATEIDAAVDTLLGTTRDVALSYLPEGWAVGRHAVVGKVHPTAKNVSAPASDVVAVSIDAQFTDRAGRGYALAPLAARTATSTSFGTVDTGATTFNTAGLRTAVHVTALSTGAGTDLTVRVQDSADGNTWSDVATIAIDSTGPTGTITETTGSVARYLRAQLTGINAASATFAVAVGKL